MRSPTPSAPAVSPESPPGVYSEVHHSLLQPIRWAGVPYNACVANMMLTFIVSVTWQSWRYVPVGVLIHVALAILTRKDPHRIEKLCRYLVARRTYAPGLLSSRARRRLDREWRRADWADLEAARDPDIMAAEDTLSRLDASLGDTAYAAEIFPRVQSEAHRHR